MRLAKLSEFRRTHFAPGSAPSLPTLRAQIERGVFPGGMVLAGRYYVDLDEFDRATGARQGHVETRAKLKKNPLLIGLV